MRIMCGEEVQYYRIDEAIGFAINQMSPMSRDLFTRYFASASRMMKTGATAINTAFGMRQIVMDTMTSAFQSREMSLGDHLTLKPVRNTAKALAGLSEKRKGIIQKLYEEYGGTLTHELKMDERSKKKFVEKGLDRSLAEALIEDIKSSPVRTIGGIPFSMLNFVVDHVSNVVAAGDLGPRLAEFEGALKNYGYEVRDNRIFDTSTGKYAMPPRHVLIRAVNAASDVTYNFRRMGRKGMTLEVYMPFFNAAVQSTEKQLRTIGGMAMPSKITGGLEPLSANKGKVAGRDYSPSRRSHSDCSLPRLHRRQHSLPTSMATTMKTQARNKHLASTAGSTSTLTRTERQTCTFRTLVNGLSLAD